jgi:hypothetical protein
MFQIAGLAYVAVLLPLRMAFEGMLYAVGTTAFWIELLVDFYFIVGAPAGTPLPPPCPTDCRRAH